MIKYPTLAQESVRTLGSDKGAPASYPSKNLHKMQLTMHAAVSASEGEERHGCASII